MSKRNEKLLLKDILESIDKIFDYTNDMSKEEFLSDEKTKDAVVRNFEVIGEAASKLSEELKAKHSDIDWKGVIGLRNVLIHDYFGVDYIIVWTIKEKFLPELKVKLKEIL
ncbi:MAG: DUF86 domain-containing protein [Ignavibacterium sp.]|jgi:uncharacterized protein with HEPN domain|uniref:HepT-like ribonuclease domain-containing protein n=1 Tax=Ignavibacterium sp. TaxID=2651167 RepID=UPI003298E861